MRCALALLLALLPAVAFAADRDDPVADPRAIVTDGDVRFTVLTPQLLRMEWGRFEDQASLVFLNRSLPVPRFDRRDEDGWLVVKTEKVELRYKKGSGRFTHENLEVRLEVAGKPVVWHPGDEDQGNLRGTLRTLDGVNGASSLEPGLVSRSGWVVVDDSERPLFDRSDWPWVEPRPEGARQDLYFFGHGHDYKQALADFTRVAGKIPMPPRFAFGLWWSRYWSYTDQELRELVSEFETHDVPLDVLVIDMDWHQTFGLRWGRHGTDQAGQPLGWTGYTWDRSYFPDPEGFLSWLHEKGLKVPLNLHPASGIQPHEDHYPEMARAMAIDPSSKKYVPFDIVDKKFASSYFDLVLRPLEKQGVDFWWLDWQQWGTTKVEGVNPTWWLNYVHFSDMERQGRVRPLLFHRWGGLGNHRYQIGFSGDTFSTWDSLAFQPYFTATASNVGYGYWSHDIGGHQPGEVDPELYTRWVQWGAFSPILRTHTTKNARSERRIWAHPAPDARAMREAVLLRYALAPYIYTAAREAYDTGVSICRPLYYEHPEAPEAYAFDREYYFGDDLLVAPVTSAASARTGLATKTVWLPEGHWIEWASGARLEGPGAIERRFGLDEIPLYVRAGAILPMQHQVRSLGEGAVDPLVFTIFPGDRGSTRVYEDQGNSTGYERGERAWTAVRHERKDGAITVEISPREGQYPGMPLERGYELRLPGALPPSSVTVDGQAIAFMRSGAGTHWSYDGQRLETTIALPRSRASARVEVVIQCQESRLASGFPGKLRRLRDAMTLLETQWPREWAPDEVVFAAQTGTRITNDPSRAGEELERFAREEPEVRAAVEKLDTDRDIVARALEILR